MSTVIESRSKVTPPPADNPWYYGYRDMNHQLPDGTLRHERIPLTLEDTLHPQEGDCIVESDLHERLLTYLASVFRWRTAEDPGVLILSDTGVYWDDSPVHRLRNGEGKSVTEFSVFVPFVVGVKIFGRRLDLDDPDGAIRAQRDHIGAAARSQCKLGKHDVIMIT